MLQLVMDSSVSCYNLTPESFVQHLTSILVGSQLLVEVHNGHDYMKTN